jgi:hypothetical protein
MKQYTLTNPLYGVKGSWPVPREVWTEGTGAPPAVKGLVWFTDGSKMWEGTGVGVYR